MEEQLILWYRDNYPLEVLREFHRCAMADETNTKNDGRIGCTAFGWIMSRIIEDIVGDDYYEQWNLDLPMQFQHIGLNGHRIFHRLFPTVPPLLFMEGLKPWRQ